MDETTHDATFDPTRRKLCGDGACVGVIGDDGRCHVCGRTFEQAAAGDEAPSPEGDGEGAGQAVDGGFDSTRRLCDDGACVGVVGDDGACRVCGRRSS